MVKVFNLAYNMIFLFFPLKEKNLNFNVGLIYGHERRRRITVLVHFAILTVGYNSKREKFTLQNESTTSSMYIIALLGVQEKCHYFTCFPIMKSIFFHFYYLSKNTVQ